MLTHGLPGVAMGAEPAAPHVLRRAPIAPGTPVLDRRLLLRIGATGTLIAAVTLLAAVLARRADDDGRTAAFLVLGLAQLGVALASRDRGSARRGVFLSVAVGCAAALQLGAVGWLPLQELLHTSSLSAGTWLVTVALSCVPGLALRLARTAGLFGSGSPGRAAPDSVA